MPARRPLRRQDEGYGQPLSPCRRRIGGSGIFETVNFLSAELGEAFLDKTDG